MIIMVNGIEVKKVDRQGRFVIPSDWRKREMVDTDEVFLLKKKGFLKIIPKRKISLTKFFDKVDLDVDAIDNWSEFEKRFYEGSR
ncbi:MAG: AbrB family transcriptional regulator [Euryarchaeota archaeon]|nr:AbrB family transcriptional regulator [Euryarchaeota archaeon]